MLTATFSTVDYIVFAIVLVLSFAIGIYHSFKHSGNNEEYLMGGRSIGIIPMAISLCASFNSAYMILGKIFDILLENIYI
jgi:Na+/proline symporter